jgi:hypothetical protein
MKDYKKLLTSLIEVVTFLFAAFGGFLKKIAPPDEAGASYPVGILSFLVLILLMILASAGRDAQSRTALGRWRLAGVLLFVLAIPVCFLYPYLLSRYTYPHQSEPGARQVSAPDEYLTADARQYKLANPAATPDDLSRNLPDGDVWTKAGVERTALWLLAAYAWLVLALAGAIFCLLEANLRSETRPVGTGPRARVSNEVT